MSDSARETETASAREAQAMHGARVQADGSDQCGEGRETRAAQGNGQTSGERHAGTFGERDWDLLGEQTCDLFGEADDDLFGEKGDTGLSIEKPSSENGETIDGGGRRDADAGRRATKDCAGGAVGVEAGVSKEDGAREAVGGMEVEEGMACGGVPG
eukprot:2483255-Pleurochrysis_carterae.AAC.1